MTHPCDRVLPARYLHSPLPARPPQISRQRTQPASRRSPVRDIRNECARVGPSRWAPVCPSTMLSETRDVAWYSQCSRRLAGTGPPRYHGDGEQLVVGQQRYGQAGSRERTRTVSTCPAPIRDRGYVTYRLTVKVSTLPRPIPLDACGRVREDAPDGQT